MESGNIVSFTYNITVVHQWQDSLCDQTLEIIPLGNGGYSPFQWGLSEVEIYTLLAVTKHGVHITNPYFEEVMWLLAGAENYKDLVVVWEQLG